MSKIKAAERFKVLLFMLAKLLISYPANSGARIRKKSEMKVPD
jgi:hypothetical protein